MAVRKATAKKIVHAVKKPTKKTVAKKVSLETLIANVKKLSDLSSTHFEYDDDYDWSCGASLRIEPNWFSLCDSNYGDVDSWKTIGEANAGILKRIDRINKFLSDKPASMFLRSIGEEMEVYSDHIDIGCKTMSFDEFDSIVKFVTEARAKNPTSAKKAVVRKIFEKAKKAKPRIKVVPFL